MNHFDAYLAYILAFCVAAIAHGQTTYIAASAELAAVEEKYTLCVDGDTLAIPAGTATWSSTFTVTKAITIHGAGIGQTIINDGGTTSARLMTVTLVVNKTTRILDIEFNKGTRTTPASGGAIQLIGPSNNNSARIAIGRCEFDNLNYVGTNNTGFQIQVEGALGVVYDCVFNFQEGNFPFYLFNRSWGASETADESWSDPANLGGEEFFFIEGNTITYNNGSNHGATLDGYAGARFVLRHNTLVRNRPEAHGTESSGRWRGTRAWEIYGNTFTGSDGGDQAANLRSGTGVIYNNTFTSFRNPPDAQGPHFALVIYRASAGPTTFLPFGRADGSNTWDANVGGGPFYSGTVSAAEWPYVDVSGTPFSTDEYVGYSIKKTSGTGGTSYITSNTSSRITYYGSTFSSFTFEAGDTFEIYKVNHAMDQPGRGQGSLVTGGETPSPPGGWNDQVTEPIYVWNNTRELDVAVGVITGFPTIRENEHYYVGTSKPGYTAYTYPHPLRGAATYTPGRLRMLRR